MHDFPNSAPKKGVLLFTPETDTIVFGISQLYAAALQSFIDGEEPQPFMSTAEPAAPQARSSEAPGQAVSQSGGASEQAAAAPRQLGQAIFVAHGKNKKPLEQVPRLIRRVL